MQTSEAQDGLFNIFHENVLAILPRYDMLADIVNKGRDSEHSEDNICEKLFISNI